MTSPTDQESSVGASSTRDEADLVIHDAVIVTVDEDNRIFESGTVVIEDNEITEVRATRERDPTCGADRVIDGDGTLVMPGLVNAHTHLELTPLFGAVSDMDLTELTSRMTALYDDFWTGDLDYLIQAGMELAALNFLRGGVTTVNSMDARPRAGIDAYAETGLRGFFGPSISDLFWDHPVDEQVDRFRSFAEEYHGSYDDRIRATLCPHDDWSVTGDLWEQCADLATEYPDIMIHTHLLELEQSNTVARSSGGDDSLDLLDEVGLLNDRLVGAHYRVADEEDIERTAEAGVSVVHCPSVFCHWNVDPDMQWTPVPQLRAAGVAVGLGIDDHYWHDSYNLFGEARQARLAANLKNGANQFDSVELLRMLTIEGARALGVDDEIGSLEPGKRADLIVLEWDVPKFTPSTNVSGQLVGHAAPADVETVVVDGSVLLDRGEYLTVEPSAVRERVTEALERFEAESEWTFSLAGSDSPDMLDVVESLPKRGPVHMLSRIAVQSAKDSLPFTR
ncbi:amidohydrolase family protein [Halobaculum sp. EA56]|uniref:amidohydrolase family protein n=1 Tax=Halobaculum sp. EA56 TaxID=3421648 RepID=UPI003EB92966